MVDDESNSASDITESNFDISCFHAVLFVMLYNVVLITECVDKCTKKDAPSSLHSCACVRKF